MTDLRERTIEVLSRHMTMDRFNFLLDLDKSHGAWLTTVKGEELLDCYSAFASLPIGWNHPALTDPAFVQRLGTYAINKPALSDTFTPELADFVETFYRVGIPERFPWIFFISGGALAVENCLKAAFDWKVQKNLAAGRKPLGSKIIHFEHCFHGRTGYTMSLTDSHDPRKTKWYPQFDWPRVPTPALRFPVNDGVIAEVEAAEAHSLARIEAAFDANPHDIAGIILEPIQCEGGDNHFRPQFLQALRRIADEREALLIFDEVQTGIGLTGTFWAWQGLGVEPDLVAFGKKTQVCGLYSSRRIEEVERNVFVEPSRINSTFGGNLVDMIRFQRVLEVIEEDDLVGNAACVGATFKSALQGLADEMDGFVTNVRGSGLLLAIDVPDEAARGAVISNAMDEGLFALSCGSRSIRFRPSLIFTEDHVGAAIERLRPALKKAASSS
ncbi:MAG: L-lysine 6-transaminase [Proteobacteria bacterium]|nr:L-lysine 6-transaminase [Pseudomonadota bacterium]